MIETKKINNTNLAVLSIEIGELFQQGWVWTLEEYPVLNGFMYEATLHRSPATIAALLEKITAIANNAPAKLTRPEILAKARAARSYHKATDDTDVDLTIPVM